MSILTAILLSLVLGGEPLPDDALAIAMASQRAVESDGPMPGTDQAETIARLLVTAHEESRFDMTRSGDSGHSHSAFQIWADATLTDTPEKAARVALRMLKDSATHCPGHILAQYAGGCDRPLAQRISDHRLKRAATLLRVARKIEATTVARTTSPP